MLYCFPGLVLSILMVPSCLFHVSILALMSIAMKLTFKEKSESLTLMSLNVNDR